MGSAADEGSESEKGRLVVQRAESIAALASGIAHELNNTLAAIGMALDLLGPSISEGDRWIATSLEDGVRRATESIRQILWLAGGKEAEPILYQPLHLIKDVQKLMSQALAPSIEVITDYPGEVCLLQGEPLLLRQLLIALCLDARDRLPRGGSITLRAGTRDLDEAYVCQRRGAQSGAHLRLDVETRSARTLAPPQQSDCAAPEVSEGLVSAIERQGGFFESERSDDLTASLSVYLPAAVMAKEDSAGESVEGTGEDGGRGEVVLIVEPNQTLREILRAALDSRGYRPLAAMEGAEGVAMLVAAEEPVALVLFAAETLLLEGAGLLRAMGRIRPDLTILVTGSRSDLAAIPDPGGMVSTLRSPFTAVDLVHALRAALRSKAS